MKRIRAVLRLLSESEADRTQPLHVRISRRDADKLLLGGPSDDDTLALAAPGNVQLTSPGLFVNYVIVDDDDAATSSSAPSDSVEVLVTRELLKRCALRDGQAMVVVRGVRCPRLSKVSLLARSAEVYAQLNRPQLWEALSGGLAQRGVLCRMNDSLAGFDGHSVLVLDCEPTRQGLIVPETQVVVIRSSQESLPSAEPTVSPGDLSKWAGTIWYTSLLIQSKQRHSQDQRAGRSRVAVSCRGSLRVHVLPQLPERLFPADVDPLNCVFLHSRTMEALKITPHSWAQACLDESSSERQLTRQVLVCGLEWLHMDSLDLAAGRSGGEEGVAYMSPHLWFHLHKQDGPTLLVRPTARLRLVAPGGRQPPAPPDTAGEFSLALVRSPTYSASIECQPLLEAHFRRPRYICKGDIVTVSILSASCPEKYRPDGSSHRHHVVFFKVTQLQGPGDAAGYLCDSRHTRLYQAGTKGCYVPAAMAAYHLEGPPHPVWDSPQPPHLAPTVERLQSLLLPFLRSGPLRKRSAPCVLLTGPHGSGKSTTLAALARSLGLHQYRVDCQDLAGDTVAATETRIKNSVLKAQKYTPCLVHLSNVEVLSPDSSGDARAVRCLGDTVHSLNEDPQEPPAVVVATTSAEPDTLHPDVAHLFLHSLTIPFPEEEARAQLLDALLCSAGPKSNSVDISYLAQRTAGSSLGDLCALVDKATMGAYDRFTRIVHAQPTAEAGAAVEAGLHLAGGPLLVQGDLLAALEWLQGSQAQAVGAPRIPAVHWDDVGGLTEVKRALTDTLQLPLRHPQLLQAGLRRSGVLLYGPPGTGKTLLAKAVATECALSFLSVKGPELINMYVGQSEENVRAVFARARSAAPCVIFFDELDSLAPNRGRSGDSGGVMDRVVSQLLAEMDGLNKSADVFVIGATNRPDLLDPAILRPGRFDQLIYVGIPSDKDSQLKILRALTRKFTLAEGRDLLCRVVEECPPNLTGADFQSLCSAAVVRAMRRHIEQLERGLVPAGGPDIPVTLEDFQVALGDLVPSVSEAELRRYEDIRSKMSAPTTSAVTA